MVSPMFSWRVSRFYAVTGVDRLRGIHLMIRNLSILLLAVASFARADFSYVMTSKSSMGGNPSVTKYYYKGNKMKTEMSSTMMIMDFDAQTITTLNPQDKSYTVKSFADINK